MEANTSNIQDTTEKKEPRKLEEMIEVELASDLMKVFVKFLKPEEGETFEPTVSDVIKKIEAEGVTYGINEELVQKLVSRPIFNLRIQVGEGTPPTDGHDGFVDYFVVPDSEYMPEMEEDGVIDFKNLEYFQMVKEGQMLCAITPPDEGTDGKDMKGRVLKAKPGRQPVSPQGKNTSLNEDGSMLYADCDGIINYVRNVVNVNDVLNIKTDVDTNTGNINFSGDVIVDGDVCAGFSIKSGGNVIIKGVVDSASIEAAGNVHIVKGINGDENTKLSIGGDFRCLYIESSEVYVKGEIIAESIIDSDITCDGDIDLCSSGKGMLVGGNINLKGNLFAKYLGNENERVTTIKMIGVETGNQEKLAALRTSRDEATKLIEDLKGQRRKYFSPFKDEENPYAAQLREVDIKLAATQQKIDEISKGIAELKDKWAFEYPGKIECKGKLYYGTRIYFGEERFQFSSENLERCRIVWQEGEIINISL